MACLSQHEKNLQLLEAVNAANITNIRKLIHNGADVNAIFHCSSTSRYFSSLSLFGFLVERVCLTLNFMDVSCYSNEEGYVSKTIVVKPIGQQLLEVSNCLVQLGAETNVTIVCREDYFDPNIELSFLDRICKTLIKESIHYTSFSTKLSRTQLCFDLFLFLLKQKTCDFGTFHYNQLVNEICTVYMEHKMSDQYEQLIFSAIYYMLMFGYTAPSGSIIDRLSHIYYKSKKNDIKLFTKKANKIKQLFSFHDYRKNIYFGSFTFSKFIWFMYCLERKNVYLCF
jgi:hypothetical protein